MDFITNLFGSSANQVDPEQVQGFLSKSPRPFLLDVRTSAEFQEGHIQGAVLIPLDDLMNKLNQVPKDQLVICICASGSRSSVATRRLEAAGYEVKNMRGGMYRWARAGLPVRKKTGR